MEQTSFILLGFILSVNVCVDGKREIVIMVHAKLVVLTTGLELKP